MVESNFQEEISNPNGISVADLFNNPFSFEVPIYQRVFTWGEEQFDRLFKDLEKHFCHSVSSTSGPERYYLGIITVVRSADEGDSHKYVLVDGQQRLTCILLLGALLGWNLDFSKLTYAARPMDRKALECVYKIGFPQDYQNVDAIAFKDQFAQIGNTAMADFLNYALSKGKGLGLLQKLKEVSATIKSALTLIISCLPDNPYRKDKFEQNRYFEKMNYGGKQLEPHEILKVRICKGLGNEYLTAWNAISNFGIFYLDSGATTGPSNSSDEALPLSAYLNDDAPEKDTFRHTVYEKCKNQLHQYELDVEAQDDLRRGLISFPMFLLHVLYLYRGEKDMKIGQEDCLLDSFLGVEEWSIEQKKHFIDLMKCYRRFLDLEIIHIKTMDRESLYFFYEPRSASQRDEIRDSVPADQQDIMEFQSMLYVSSGNDQTWLITAFNKKFSRLAEGGLEALKSIMRNHLLDRQTKDYISQAQNGWPTDCLKYGTENRRWLSLLDYLLWEKYTKSEKDSKTDPIFAPLFEASRFKGYEGQICSAIRNYVFRKNRSVEHLHAQTDSEATHPEDWKAQKDIFGNLALISAGRNSEYGNQSVGGKADRVVKLLVDGGNQGSKIESIKLLLMLAECNGDDSKWRVEAAHAHANKMLDVLQSFLMDNGDREPFGSTSRE